MKTKFRKCYESPASTALAIEPVRILDNSLTDYKYGGLDETIMSVEEFTLPIIPDDPLTSLPDIMF
jgi:hypothetical protein